MTTPLKNILEPLACVGTCWPPRRRRRKHPPTCRPRATHAEWHTHSRQRAFPAKAHEQAARHVPVHDGDLLLAAHRKATVTALAQRHASQIIALEEKLGISVELQFQRFVLRSHPLFMAVLQQRYLAHIAIGIGFLAYGFTYFPRARFTAVQRTIALDNLLAFPTLSLWRCAPRGLMPPAFGFVDVLHPSVDSGIGGETSAWGNNRFQLTLAAMPSLHFGTSLLISTCVVLISRFSESAVKAANDKQMAARKLALQAPLQAGHQFTLAYESPLQNPAPNARKLPRVPGPGPTVVQLCDELQQGINGFSQVWRAECIDDPGTCLALKIIQPSICRGIAEHPIDEYYDPWDLAHNEAWVYQHLPHYQGLLIPYSSGLSTIVTPCREEAWVLVLEFIPGLTVHDVLDSASISNIRDFCALGSNAVREFVQGGWTLHDIRSPNFILTGAPGTSAAVIIDLPLQAHGNNCQHRIHRRLPSAGILFQVPA
ncbi:PAP2 superfamily-domain-containing protein [Mycena amicta]|nr:PAP2 superfamily-domain-containing protein [Mycena amicta]